MLLATWSPRGVSPLENEDKAGAGMQGRRVMTGYQVGKPKTSLFCVVKPELGFCGL